MSLSELEKGDEAIIMNIYADKDLRRRLYMFGIIKNEILVLKECSLGKQTIGVLAGQTFVALRIDEAEKIEVEKI